MVRPEELYERADYLPLHLARRVGVLRIVADPDQATPGRKDILILKQPALSLPPVSGILTTRFSSPLSHINLLAKGWGIPNAYLRGADLRFKPLEGQVVVYETGASSCSLREATAQEREAFLKEGVARGGMLAPRTDLACAELGELSALRREDALRYGSKAANLGEILHAMAAGEVKGAAVPPGFGIPFLHCKRFYESNGLLPEIHALLDEPRFRADPAYRKDKLSALRARIQSGRMDPELAKEVQAKAQAMFAGRGVFARSSTNSEDLPNFSGAGLYTSVPNVKGDAALVEAVKTVWASLWNYEAYEAREAAGIDHFQVWAAVLVQEGVNAASAGVLITQNPFDPEDHAGVYINAKRGLGIRVVEGRRMAEQLIFRPRSNSVRVLTRSDDDTMLKFDPAGGVREVRIETERAVLTDNLVRRLAASALQVKKLFGDRDQDMEWVVAEDRIYLVQSRPYLDPR